MVGRCGRRLGAMVGVLHGLMGAGAAIGAKTSRCQVPGDQVSLQGRVRLVTHAGPPNYASIQRGDAREVHPMLFVDRALCVSLPGPGAGGKRWQVRRLQLIDWPNQYPSSGAGGCQKACTLTGRLMVAESGHHHTPVLLQLD